MVYTVELPGIRLKAALQDGLRHGWDNYCRLHMAKPHTPVGTPTSL